VNKHILVTGVQKIFFNSFAISTEYKYLSIIIFNIII